MKSGKKNKKKRGKDKPNPSSNGFMNSFNKKMSENFQKQIRNSPMWDQMVSQFGEEKAKELLKECKGEMEPSPFFE